MVSQQKKIYISHFLSAWGDRMWAFSGGLFFIEITPGSLRLLAIYAAALSLTIVFFGSSVGRWVDRTKRLKAAQSSLVLQNVMVCLCTGLLCYVINDRTYLTSIWNGWAMIICKAAVILMAMVAQLGTLASSLCITKDWIIVISGNDETKLSTMNSVMRTIDLSTKMVAPVLVGVIMSYWGTVVGGVFIASWNVVSMIIEYALLYNLYITTPELRKPKGNEKKLSSEKLPAKWKDAIITWKKYFERKTCRPGMALALLYMTVLALDNYTIAYIFESGVSKAILGVMASIGSLAGIFGSILFPFLQRKLGTIKTGIFGFCFEFTCLTFCVVAMFAPGTLFVPSALFGQEEVSSILNKDSNVDRNYTSVILLLIGIITSRLGLWLADLTVNLILQKETAVDERGGINGVQYSLNQLFNLIRSLLLILLPTMQTFGYLVFLSFFSVGISCILFILYSRQATLIREKIVNVDAEEAQGLLIEEDVV